MSKLFHNRFFLNLVSLLFLFFLATAVYSQEIYFGNLHGHTVKSEGSGTPLNAYRYARNKAKIDFLLLSEHNHSSVAIISRNTKLYSDASNRNSSVRAANSRNDAGEFVALYGQEFYTHSSGNHINVFDIS